MTKPGTPRKTSMLTRRLFHHFGKEQRRNPFPSVVDRGLAALVLWHVSSTTDFHRLHKRAPLPNQSTCPALVLSRPRILRVATTVAGLQRRSPTLCTSSGRAAIILRKRTPPS